jgi:hypothetical protein
MSRVEASNEVLACRGWWSHTVAESW